MPKQSQTKSLGMLQDFASTPSFPPESDRIASLERRVATLEGLLNDVMHHLDKPDTQPKSKTKQTPKKAKKSKPKKTPPSEIITALLKKNPFSRAEIEAETNMDTEAILKCITWMRKQDLIEKTTDKDGDGNSRWRLKQ